MVTTLLYLLASNIWYSQSLRPCHNFLHLTFRIECNIAFWKNTYFIFIVDFATDVPNPPVCPLPCRPTLLSLWPSPHCGLCIHVIWLFSSLSFLMHQWLFLLFCVLMILPLLSNFKSLRFLCSHLLYYKITIGQQLQHWYLYSRPFFLEFRVSHEFVIYISNWIYKNKIEFLTSAL